MWAQQRNNSFVHLTVYLIIIVRFHQLSGWLHGLVLVTTTVITYNQEFINYFCNKIHTLGLYFMNKPLSVMSVSIQIYLLHTRVTFR